MRTHRKDVLNSVQNMLNGNPDLPTPFGDNRLGKKWFQLFMNRHRDISVRVPERVSKARACITEKVIRAWFENVRKDLADINALYVLEDPSRIFNTDETCIQLAPKGDKVLGEKNWKNVFEISAGPEKSTLTLLGT